MLNVTRNLLILAVGVGAAVPTLASAQSKSATGAVFVMTNDANKNEVIAFERAANGTLGDSVSYDTHGRGSGGITDPLESQGSLTLSRDHSLLFAVNAGSGDVTVFNVHKSGALNFHSNTPSGGAQPSAIAEFNGLVYVLNSGGAGSLVGFNLNNGGQLRQIKNSTAFLTGATTGGASLAFSPDGQFLVVTERIANNIDVFHVQRDGTLSPIVVNSQPRPRHLLRSLRPQRSRHRLRDRPGRRHQRLHHLLLQSQRQRHRHRDHPHPGNLRGWKLLGRNHP